MAKGKYMNCLKAETLREIANWAAKDLTDAQLASDMGISPTTLYGWVNTYADIKDALTCGR